MPIELAGQVRKLPPEELGLPTEEPVVKAEYPQNCPNCSAFTGGADTCPSCEELISPIERNSSTG